MLKELHQGFRESGFESRRCLRMPRRKGSRAEKVSSPLVICTRRMRGKLQKNKVAGSNPAPAAINANPRIKLGRRRAADSIFEYGKARQHRQMISGIGIWQGSSEVEHVTISSPLVDCPALRRAV